MSRFKKLLNSVKTGSVQHGKHSIKFQYYNTGNEVEIGEITKTLSLVLNKWDITDDNGVMLPIDANVMYEQLPYKLLLSIYNEINKDSPIVEVF